MSIQINLVDPATNTIRPFAEFANRHVFHEQDSRFAESAYHWLVFLHQAGLTAEGLGSVGYTKPGLLDKLRKTLAPHESSHTRKPPTRRHHPAGQAYKRIFMTEADYMVGEGAMQYLGRPQTRIRQSQISDIPTTEEAKAACIDVMVAALKNMAGRLPGFEAQVNQVKFTSASIFEFLAWRLFVSYPPLDLQLKTLANITSTDRLLPGPTRNSQGLALGNRLLLAGVQHLDGSLD